MVGQWDRKTGYAKLPLPYVQSVTLAGGRPRVLSTFDLDPRAEVHEGLEVVGGLDQHDPAALDGAAGLMLPGGGDIDPAWYGEPPHPRTKNISHQRDRFELTLLKAALERDLPVLAICKGMQLLNVHLGGTLTQHLADDQDRLDHDRDRPRAEPAHKIRIEDDSLLGEMLGVRNANVNSHHHQGIGRVAPGLREVAWAEDDTLEAFELTSARWVVAVQWHPEAMTPMDDLQLQIFEKFVAVTRAAARAAREGRSTTPVRSG
ncbi:MAG: gamma-glutamyl-gamma-aminobutyrate hydrolase family protein [Actinomycetota bacterium]